MAKSYFFRLDGDEDYLTQGFPQLLSEIWTSTTGTNNYHVHCISVSRDNFHGPT
jgi:hypothetical protein